MPDPSKSVAHAPGALPEVQLEVRQGGRTASYAFNHVDFLIGAVPGCDLRIPGADLPSVLCLLARHAGGLVLRKLAPTQLLLVNGQTVSAAELADGDRITVGAVDLFVRMKAAPAAPAPSQATSPRLDAELEKKAHELRAQIHRFHEERQAFVRAQETEAREHEARVADLEDREKALKEQVAALSASSKGDKPSRQEEVHLADIDRQRQELAGQRQELADIRRQLYERYQERRDRLAGLQEAVDRAARKVQERKRLLEAEEQNLQLRKQADAGRQADLARKSGELEQQSRGFHQERRALETQQEAREAGVAAKLADLQRREETLAGERRDLDGRLKQYQADLLRLDRLGGSIEQREKGLALQEKAFADKLTQLQADSADLEAEVVRLDAWRAEQTVEKERLDRQKSEQDAVQSQLAQRAAALEGQQATLATLRTRLERMREEVRAQEQQLGAERQRQAQAEEALAEERQALEESRVELEAEKTAGEAERAGLLERSAVLDAAVARLKAAQDDLARQESANAERARELDGSRQALAADEGVLENKLQQIAEAQERLDQERSTLRERTQSLAQAEQAREALQEQLRKRSEELAQRQKTLNEKLQEAEAKAGALDARRAELDRQHEEAQAQLDQMRADLSAQSEALADRQADLASKESHQTRQFEQLQALGKEIAAQRKALAQERAASALELEEWLATQKSARTEFEALRKDAIELQRQLPDLELHAGTTLERLTHAREQLRDHLAELHSYVHACQDDLDQLRSRIQKDESHLQEEEQALRLRQEEHRLAMVAFRQQLIGWQGQIADMKRLLASDETRLERKEARVAEQVKELDQTTEKLSRQAEELQQQQEAVAGRRQEMDRHLVDMREWYRRKLRDLAGIDLAAIDLSEEIAELADEGQIVPMPPRTDAIPAKGPFADSDAIVPTGRNILSLTEPVDASDRQLGDTLAQLELVDRETLSALLVEARRQRRSLRQVLLAGGVVTVYQLALIEAGQLERLMLGPVRVVDRLRVSRWETTYRVFDPRRSQEAVLRHLAPDAMEDAVRPDEYRQRFREAMLDEPNLACTLEVLDIGGRPAVLQEWLHGLPSSDWPPLAAAPGVCFRLLMQAALGLAAVHRANLTHGHLSDAALFLTSEGLLKITGFGEPPWLTGLEDETTARGDLRALGRIVSSWCTPTGVRKGPKARPLPESLVTILYRLNAEGEAAYQSAAQLLEDLDQAGADIPANAEAWDRLLRYVRDHGTAEALLKQTA